MKTRKELLIRIGALNLDLIVETKKGLEMEKTIASLKESEERAHSTNMALVSEANKLAEEICVLWGFIGLLIKRGDEIK